jgi:hypothetical protein
MTGDIFAAVQDPQRAGTGCNKGHAGDTHDDTRRCGARPPTCRDRWRRRCAVSRRLRRCKARPPSFRDRRRRAECRRHRSETVGGKRHAVDIAAAAPQRAGTGSCVQ